MQHCDSKQCRDQVSVPPVCHIKPAFTAFALDSSELHRLLPGLDAYDGSDSGNISPSFIKRFGDVFWPTLFDVFRTMLIDGNFSVNWRPYNFSMVPKGPLSPLLENVHLISITSILSKGYERLASARLGIFLNQIVFCIVFCYLSRMPSLRVMVRVPPFSISLTSCRHHWKGDVRQGLSR